MKKSKNYISDWLEKHGDAEIDKIVEMEITEILRKQRKRNPQIYSVWGQIYIFPYIKITHDKALNGDIELIIGWINKELVITL